MDLREQDCEMRYLAASVGAALCISPRRRLPPTDPLGSAGCAPAGLKALCPRAVGMPRAVRAAAIAWGVVMPRARISAIT
jgi:hypothetical protein